MEIEIIRDKTFYVIDMGSRYIKYLCNSLINMGYYIRVLAWYDPYIRPDFDRNIDYVNGVILSGSPSNIIPHTKFPVIGDYLLNQNKIPVLGICYGMQIINHTLDGWVVKNKKSEEGAVKLNIIEESKLYDGIDLTQTPFAGKIWMHHDYVVDHIPPGFKITSSTKLTPIASYERDNIYGVQYHPELKTNMGQQILHNFCEKICK